MATTDQELKQLAIRALAGDQSAMSELDHHLRKRIVRFVAGRLNSWSDYAEDITNETFIRAWARLESYDSSKGTFQAWLFTIAYNLTVDFLRRHRWESECVRSMDECEEQLALGHHPAHYPPRLEDNSQGIASKLDARNALAHALKALSPREKQCLLLQVVKELTYEEIAQHLRDTGDTSITVGAVGSYISCAKKKLRTLLDRDDLL